MSLLVLRPLTPREQAEITVQQTIRESCAKFIGQPTHQNTIHAVKATIDGELQRLYNEAKLPGDIKVAEIEDQGGGQFRVRIEYPDPVPPF